MPNNHSSHETDDEQTFENALAALLEAAADNGVDLTEQPQTVTLSDGTTWELVIDAFQSAADDHKDE